MDFLCGEVGTDTNSVHLTMLCAPAEQLFPTVDYSAYCWISSETHEAITSFNIFYYTSLYYLFPHESA